jgi:hypothetical protein
MTSAYHEGMRRLQDLFDTGAGDPAHIAEPSAT